MPRQRKSASRAPARPLELLSRSSVFRRQRLADGRSPAALARTLHYHVTTGRLTLVRRGVYASVDRPDPYAVAACLTSDAVLAYNGALQLHLLDDELPKRLSLMTSDRLGRFRFDGVSYHGILPPLAVRDAPDFGGEVVTVERQGVSIRATTLARTFVDCLDRLDVAYDLIDLWDLFRANRFDPRAAMRYARQLGNRVVAARLGLFLMAHPLLRLLDSEVTSLDPLVPTTPAWIDPRDHSPRQSLHGRWNLYVPDKLAARMSRH